MGLAPKGLGGAWIESRYQRVLEAIELKGPHARPQDIVPINTHGGLLAYGAPWEVPAMFNIIESYMQLTGKAESRQVHNARRALVYGNGGIFSHSAVAILGNGLY